MKLNDIAKKLGVSAASISIVRHGKSGVSPATRRQIQMALEENGYTYKDYTVPGLTIRKDPAGISNYMCLLKYNRSALLTEKNEGFVDNVISTVGAYARSEGYELIYRCVQHTHYHDVLQEIAESNCSGLLVIGTEMERNEIIDLTSLRKPTVLLDCDHPNMLISSVTMNNRALAYEAVTHLIEKSKGDVGYLQSCIRTGNCKSRENGYYEALRDYGIKINKNHVFCLTPSLMGAYNDMLAQLSLGRELPRALFADNDVIAVGAMQAMSQHEIHVPDDVYLVGVDNTMLAQVSSPPLSSMQISHSELGLRAITLLLEHIAHPELSPEQIYISSKLVIRESSMTVK